MTDEESFLRQVFVAHEDLTPDGSGLASRAKVLAAKQRKRRVVATVMGGMVSVVAMTVAIAAPVFWLGDGGVDDPIAVTPATSSSPTLDPAQAKCLTLTSMPVLSGNKGANVAQDRTTTLNVRVGARLTVPALEVDYCEIDVQFNSAQPSSPLERQDKSHYKAVAPGTVVLTFSRAMCWASQDPQCLGGIDLLGRVVVRVEPKPVVPPPNGPCATEDYKAVLESGPGTNSRLFWISARPTSSSVNCVLDGTATLTIHSDGMLTTIPNNPNSVNVHEVLRSGHAVVVIWSWIKSYCKTDWPFVVDGDLAGATDQMKGKDLGPGCLDGQKPTETGPGLRFDQTRTN